MARPANISATRIRNPYHHKGWSSAVRTSKRMTTCPTCGGDVFTNGTSGRWKCMGCDRTVKGCTCNHTTDEER